MQSQSSRSSYVLPRGRKLTAETNKFLDRLATCALMLALAVGVIIAVVWLVELCSQIGRSVPLRAELAYARNPTNAVPRPRERVTPLTQR